MSLPRVRFTVRKAMLAVAILAVLLAYFLVPLGRLTVYHRVQREMDAAIRALEYRVPPGVSPAVWECAWGWTSTAYGNVCFSEEHVSTEELYRLRKDLMPKLQGPVDLQTLVWVWDRLAQTGPHGRRYVGQHKPSFLECLPPGTVPTASPGPELAGSQQESRKRELTSS
jgi:hypothetical protein